LNYGQAYGSNTGFQFFTINNGSYANYAKLYASGYQTPSDYRIKSNVTNVDETMISVDNLQPVRYTNISQNNKIEFGFIAHELQEQYPELVEGEKDGPNLQSVNYIGLIPILIAEIKSLRARVAALENPPAP
jgi:hypothetical protein